MNEKEKSKIFSFPRNVFFLGMVSFLNDLASDMVFPFIPVFLTSVLGASAGFVGLVEGIADSTASILKIFSGRWADKVRRYKSFVVFGYSLSAITKPFLAFALAPWHVLAVRFADRVGKGMRDAPRDALISFSVEKKDIGRSFGFQRAADTMGGALGPLIAFVILPLIDNNLRTLFLLSFVASFFAVAVLKIFVNEARPSLSAAAVSESVKIVLPKFEFKFLGAPFAIFLAASTIFSLGKTSQAFLLLKAEHSGVAIALLPIIYFVSNIVFAFFSTPAGVLSDKIGHRNTFMIGMLIFSGTYFLFARETSGLAIWLLFALYGLHSALTEGVGRAIVADLVEERWRATAYGMYNAFTGFALLPASFIFGILWDRFGISYAFNYGAALGLIAFIVFAFLRMRNGRKINAPEVSSGAVGN